MANIIVTRNRGWFEKIGKYNYGELEDMELPDTVAFDSETSGLDCLIEKVFAIQIGTGKDNYLIDLQEYDTPIEQGKQIHIKEVLPYLKNKTLVGQNISFDLGFLYMQGFFPDNVYDTMIASKILYNGEPPNFLHGFAHIMERELGIIYDKSEQKNINKIKLSTTKSIQYCFNDVDRLLELHDNLYKKLRDYNALETYHLNCQYLKALTYCELVGLPINEVKWRARIEKDKLDSLKYQKIVNEYIYDKLPKFRKNQLNLFENTKEVNCLLSSPKQMINVFKGFGIDIIDDEGKESIEESVIQKSSHEFVKLWLDYKNSEHLVTTFGENILNKIRWGHIYTRYNPIVDTCRISTRRGQINFLNFPKSMEIRECFEASPGYKIVSADYTGQENAVGADFTLDEVMLKAVIDGADLHCAFARVIYPEIATLTDKEIKKLHADKRQYAKSPRFAFSYGGSGHTVAKNLNISLERGNQLETQYKELHKGIYMWGDKICEESVKNGYIESTMGFKLRLPQFERFKKLQDKINGFSKEFWTTYKAGKNQQKELWANIESKKLDNTLEEYQITDIKSYNLYRENKEDISKYFQLKSQYYRLCLNNPIQAKSAHQTKQAVIYLFDYIKEHNHIGRARISVVMHDRQNCYA